MRLRSLGMAAGLSSLRGTAVNVYVPYTKLRPETRAAVPPGAVLTWVGSHEHNYWGLLADLWARGDTFIVVEHDIVPHASALRELDACPSEWCAFPYQVGDGMETTALGCTKFGAGLIARHPDLLRSIGPRHRSWRGLDSLVVGGLHQRREKEHVHGPAVRHLQAPAPARRMPSVRLKFTGDGTRYLNGVPAADHEQTDPATVAIALESGLYVEDTTPAPKKTKSQPAPAEEAAVSATDSAPTSEE